MNGQQLEEVNAFQYLGATLTKDGRSRTEMKVILAMATSSMTKRTTIWKSKEISFPIKLKLYKALIQTILLYGSETWTLTAETAKRIQSFETKCHRKLLGISW